MLHREKVRRPVSTVLPHAHPALHPAVHVGGVGETDVGLHPDMDAGVGFNHGTWSGVSQIRHIYVLPLTLATVEARLR